MVSLLQCNPGYNSNSPTRVMKITKAASASAHTRARGNLCPPGGRPALRVGVDGGREEAFPSQNTQKSEKGSPRFIHLPADTPQQKLFLPVAKKLRPENSSRKPPSLKAVLRGIVEFLSTRLNVFFAVMDSCRRVSEAPLGYRVWFVLCRKFK